MNPANKQCGDCEGPLGLPMKDAQAQMLESLLKTLPAEDRELCRHVTAKAPTEVLDGERADVSWISTEEIDRENEIVIARGMNDSHFKLNPIVTFQHQYWNPPVGRSLWRKRAKDGQLAGIKAKTQYFKRPATWPEADEWQPDTILTLIQAGMLNGKSVGFLRLKSHSPSSHEIAANPDLVNVGRIIDEWLLLEYACTFLPMNQAALVEAVSKSGVPNNQLVNLGIMTAELATVATEPTAIGHTTEAELQRSINTRIAGYDYAGLAQRTITDAIDRARGRI